MQSQSHYFLLKTWGISQAGQPSGAEPPSPSVYFQRFMII